MPRGILRCNSLIGAVLIRYGGPTVPVTQGDVARRAGVSPRTVSNVVNEFPLVSDELRERVQRAIDELGYQPNQAARNLRRGRPRVSGVGGAGRSPPGFFF